MSKEINNEVLKDAQYRKGLSIAFFNATNNAMQIVQLLGKDLKNTDLKIVQDEIVYWRDWLLTEHQSYYSKVIANVGSNYKAEDTIAKLNATKSLAELKSVWVSISEDERKDKDILKVVSQLKKKYETVQLD